MAYTIGLDELKQTFNYISTNVLDQCLEAAQMAAAKVLESAIQSAAPVAHDTMNPWGKGFNSRPRHPSGQLRESVGVFKQADKSAMQSANIYRVKVGPGNKGGFYGWFLSKGWQTAGGKRISRKSSKTTHSQSGTVSSRKVMAPYPDWLDRAAESAREQAEAAGAQAFGEKMTELLAGRI
jgi:hypothetical protein